MRVALVAFKSLTIYALQLANALSKLAEVHFFVSDQAVNPYLEHVDPNIKLHLTKTFRWRNPKGLYVSLQLIREIKKIRCQVAHLILYEPWFNLWIPLIKSFPLLTTIHDVKYHIGDRQSNIVPQAITDLAARFSFGLIVHGDGLKGQLTRAFKRNPDHVFVIPHMNSSFYRHWEKSGIKEETNRILFFGSIWEYKGLHYLMQAESLLAKHLDHFKIVIAGVGEDFAKYRKYIVDPDHYEIMNEYIADERVAELFQKASVVVLPYIEASQSGVVPLAFAFGKPVVVTRVGSIPEIVDHGKNGFIVPPRDSEKLAKAILQILTNPRLRKRMSHEAKVKANGDLSWDRVARLHLEAYQHTLARWKKTRRLDVLSDRNN
jgi:glycosyltransferase involved in cell wall biosynthesis